jgi:hypothetical protein
MPDSGSTKTERAVQPSFRKISFFNSLALALAISTAHVWFASMPDRADRPMAAAAVRYDPFDVEPAGFAPLKLAGAWRVQVGDDRFGGVSAFAVEDGRLLALTDSGTIVSLPRPGSPGPAIVRDLPGGPGTPAFKRNRDSEALARDPRGRGWWVAFENWNQLWLYTADFRRPVARIDLGSSRWRINKGIEAMVADQGGLTLIPERGAQWLRMGSGELASGPMANEFGNVSDAVGMADGRLILSARELGPGGLAKHLLVAEVDGRKLRLRALARLGLPRTANVEAIAAEPHAGGTRLWLMTDNDFRPRAPTLLVALELP